jgi:hypothetical protein
MIEIIGEEGTSEYFAALSIKEAFEKLWPGISNSPASQEIIKIVVSVKISGYEVSDIDIVVSCNFNKERKFIPNKVIHNNSGGRVVKRPVEIKNFVLAVEVKDHDEDGVQINGDNILVRYKSGWKSASDQNMKQVHSLVAYFKDLGREIFVHRCLVMRGISKLRQGGAVASEFSGVDFLTAITSVSRVHKTARGYLFSSASSAEMVNVLEAPIFKLLKPSNLDRRRMDAIVTSTPESQLVLDNIGKKMVTLRGHGGAGKTIMLLQMAWKAYDERGERSIVLTYNHALAADIRRSLALLGIPSEPEEGGIVVNTVMSFMYSWFKQLGLVESWEDADFDNYVSYCENIIDLLKEGAITSRDIENVISDDPDKFDFDCIVVDESQDWPQPEVDLLKSLYKPENIALADGIDQLLRGKRSNWYRDVENDRELTVTLSRCLRMKQNLATFCNQVAHVSNVKWEVKPNNKATGGKVIFLKKPFYGYPELISGVLEKAKDKGNSEIDFLICVPPAGVKKENGKKHSIVGNKLKSLGYQIWDGVDPNVRKDFPRSLEQFRIVQYQSCRGLEGWTVFLHAADIYWEHSRQRRQMQGLTPEQELSFIDIDEVASRDAWYKILISLTRPIDTLVIDVSNLESEFSKKLQRIAKKFPDIIQEFD